MKRHLGNRPLRWLLAGLLLLASLGGARARPGAAAPAEAMSSLLLGSLTNSSTLVQTPADGLFTVLAQQAQSSIDVALYDFNRASVRDALLAAKARGVSITTVGDNEDSTHPSYAPFYQSLVNASIPLTLDTTTALMHNKFAVFDNSVTWTGSANFSDNAFVRNGENVVVITSTVVANIYATEFNEMFGGKFHKQKTDNTPHSATVAGSALEIAFAPTDGVEARIVNALNSASASIQVAMFTFTNATIAQALIAAKNRGVAVEVLFDDQADGSQFSQRDPLCDAGVTVRVKNWSPTLHDKYAVVDAGTASDPLVVTGSTNWTANAVEANDENLLIVHSGDLASSFANDFARLRAAIAPGGFSCNAGPDNAPEPRLYLPLVQRGAAAPAGQARITAIEAAPPAALDEYVLIENVGAGPLDMAGWKLSDAANTTYTFPAFTLAAGAQVKVWVKAGTDDAANLYWGRASAVWNNGGDTATLRDAQGTVVSTYTYP